jgi:hypothetical protein
MAEKRDYIEGIMDWLDGDELVFDHTVVFDHTL